MKKYNMIIIALLVLSIGKIIQSSDSEDVMIESIDLTVEYNQDGKTAVMEAFRSKRNDEILKRNETRKFGQLEWHSIGYPTLTNLPSKHSSYPISNVFEITPTGFYILIEVLTDTQKKKFKDRVKAKYGINIDKSQIIKLVPSALKCTAKVVCSNGSPVTLYGEAKTLTNFPLNVEFDDVPLKSKEMKCFEHHLIEHHQLKIDCVIRKKSKVVKQNTFSISWEQMSRINLIDKLFGNASEVYVSRQQMAELAAEVHQSMNVYEEYEIREKEFSSDFIEGLIKQKVADFKPVSIDDVLKSFSSYSAKDIDPNIIKKNLSKVLKVQTNGNKKHIIVDSEYNGSKSERDRNETGFRVGWFNLKGSVNYANEKETSWANSGRDLKDQLDELNSHSQDDVEWELEGEQIVPKSLNVSRLVKSSFNQKLNFERIKRIVEDYIFNKKFSLEYKDDKKKFFKRLSNKLIESESSSHILETIHSASLLKCIEACEENSNCHYVFESNENECNLYDKTGYFFIKEASSTSSGNKRRLYHRNIFSKKEHKGYKLTNWFKQIDGGNITSSIKCWEECLNEFDCVAITYDRSNSDCYLFEHDDFKVESINDNNFVTISFEETLKTHRYEKTVLTNEYLSLTAIKSESLCWQECLKDSNQCFAVSYMKKKCKLYRKGEYLVINNNTDWVTISFDNEMVDKKQPSEYQNMKLVGRHLNEFNNETRYSCWNKCLSERECVAITFTQEICRLFNKGMFHFVRDNNSISIFTQPEKRKSATNYDVVKHALNKYSFKNTLLTNEYRVLPNTRSEISCCFECLKSVECVAISYNKRKCKMYRNEEYLVVNSTDWVSISLEAKQFDKMYSTEYEKTKLVGEFLDQGNSYYTNLSSVCWNKCLEEKNKCVAISLKDGICKFYAEGQFIVTRDEDSISVFSNRIKLNKNYSTIHENTILVNEYKIINSSSKVSCWNECLKSSKHECVGISYSDAKCNLYRHGEYLLKREENWSSILLEDESKYMVYIDMKQNTRLINHFEHSETESEFLCWKKCLKRVQCVAITYSNRNCYFYKEGEYRVERENGWISVAYENQKLERKYTKRYNKTQVSGLFLAISNSESEENCWNECVNRSEICIAISFGENLCHLVKRGEYQHRRFNDWVSIYIESESPIKSERSLDYSPKMYNDGHEDYVWPLAILQNGDLVSGGGDIAIKIWNPTDGTLKQTLYSHDNNVNSLVVLHNGRLVSGSFDNTIKIWNIENYEVERTLTTHTGGIYCFAVFPNKNFASGSCDKTIIIWSASGEYIKTLLDHTGCVVSLAVLPSGELASGSCDRTIKIWASDGSFKKSLSGHANCVYSLVILDIGLLVSGSFDNTTKIWNENGQQMYTNSYDSKIRSLAVLPNEDLLIGFSDGNIRIKDKNKLQNQQVKSILNRHSTEVNSFAIFSNGDFASASDDKKLIIWSQN